MKAINVFLAIAVSLLIAVLVLEGGLRIVGFGPPETLNEFHDKLGWAKTPHAVVERSTPEFDVTFEINAHGLRDDEDLEPRKKPGTYRVLCLGDSFVLGYTVDRDDLFVDQLEGWWGSEQRRVEVINAGTEGYSTDQEAVWLREYGLGYEPDVVVLFPFLNDIYWNGQEFYNRYPKPLFAPDGNLATGTLADPGSGGLAKRLAITRFLGMLAGGGGSDEHFWTPPGASRPVYREFAAFLTDTPGFLEDALDRTRGAMKALKADCDTAGARLVVCPIPPEASIHEHERKKYGQILGGIPDTAWDPDKPVNTFLAIAGELGIETMDPRQRFLAEADDERLYFDEEWHFTPAGNRVLTEFLYDEFDNRGIFPEAHRAIEKGGIPESHTERGLPTWTKVYALLWIALSVLYIGHYREEPIWQPPLKIAALLAAIFTIVIGGGKLIAMLPPEYAQTALILFVLIILGFIAFKLGRRLGTIAELLKAFTLRGHWYLMPLVVVLLTIGSLLVVAASSPLVAPFIYTLF